MRVIGGRLSGRRFGAPKGRSTRPTSDRAREALASALQSRDAFCDARVLDLFAGTGALTFEALSRGASQALVVDRDPRALKQVAESAKELGLGAEVRTARVDLLKDPAAAVQRLASADGGFSLVFVDAPYAEIDSVSRVLDALIASRQLMAGAWVVVEHPGDRDWRWPKGLASQADYRYGRIGISLGVYEPEKGRQ
ncbi:MAG: RsmD family RNA methyltransferase [Myxococcales bacterium]|nr:RsmD family RNA methyltransferase [Myxococcales bacterium]